MAKLEIKKGAFKVRFASGEPMTEAVVGDTIELTEEEVGHWYTQAAIDEGRAVVLPDDEDEDADQDSQGDPGDDPETTLNLVQRSELEATEAKLAEETTAREQAESKLADEVTAHTATKVKLSAAEAKVEELETKLQEKEGPAADLEPEDIEARMLAVFPKLTDDAYKTDGTPKVKSVETLLGENVTADQVSAAWAKFQEGQE